MSIKIEERKEVMEKFGTVNAGKHHIKVHNKNKAAYVSGKQISLQDFKPEYGPNARHFSDDEIKRRHLGKIRCQVVYKTADDLKGVLEKYFAE